MKSQLSRARSQMHALRLPRRTIRLRLTAVYAILFLVSGAGVLAITYLLTEDHIAPAQVTAGGKAFEIVRRGSGAGAGAGAAGARVFLPAPPSGGSQVCYVGAGPSPGTSPSPGGGAGAGPSAGGGTSPGGGTSNGTSSARTMTPGQASQCADILRARVTSLQTQVAAQRSDYLNSLLIGSGIALAAMTLAALGLGWLVSGRVLSPLRTITRAARNISASNLHERLALDGPDDELKELGDTVDGLLGRLESSFAAQRQFVANASHELRTPLARQRTLVEIALADPDRTVDSLAAACKRVLAAGQQQERLIEGLLTLARSQRGLDQFEPVDLAVVTQETVLSRSSDAHHRDIKLEVVASPAVFPGDPRLAERLITNLLDNAIRHNHAGGTVLVCTGSASGQAVLSVTNTGPVIHPAEVPGLFEPFRHRGTMRTSDGDSPGLGLSIVGAIAAAHGASVWVWAPPEGGLDIQVRFPGQLALGGAPAASPGTPAAMPGTSAAMPSTSAKGGLVDRAEPVTASASASSPRGG